MHILLQGVEPVISTNTETIQILTAFLIGLLPTIYTFFKDKTRWRDERQVVTSQAGLNQSEAIENIATAAGQLLEQSHKLVEKNLTLVSNYETALERQAAMLDTEKQHRLSQEAKFLSEIAALKKQIADITDTMAECSTEIVNILVDLQSGNPIEHDRLAVLQRKWRG